MIYRAREPQTSYGRPIGILILEQQIPGPPGTPGMLVSGGGSLNAEHLRLACAGEDARIVLASMEGKPYFSAAVRDESGELDFEGVTAEVVEVAQTLFRGHPEVKALLFECVDL